MTGRAATLLCLALLAGCVSGGVPVPAPVAASLTAKPPVPDELLTGTQGDTERQGEASAFAAVEARAPIVAPYDPWQTMSQPESRYILGRDEEAAAVAAGARVIARSEHYVTMAWRMQRVPIGGSIEANIARWGPPGTRERFACQYARPHGNPDGATVLQWALDQGIITGGSGWVPASDGQAVGDLKATCDAAIYNPYCAVHDCSGAGGLPDTGCTEWRGWRAGPAPPGVIANGFVGPPQGCPPPASCTGRCCYIISSAFRAPRYLAACLQPEPPPLPFCGDGDCNGAETCETCASDCGGCPPPPTVCGNGPPPERGEDCSTCPADMPAGACEPAGSCVEAIDAVGSAVDAARIACGGGALTALVEPELDWLCNGTCEWDDAIRCPQDCPGELACGAERASLEAAAREFARCEAQ